MVKFTINGEAKSVEADPAMPILWVVREQLGLTGTKFGCGAALCGACTVHLDGQPVRSCSTPIGEAEGRAITTIEGIAGPEGELSQRPAGLDQRTGAAMRLLPVGPDHGRHGPAAR